MALILYNPDKEVMYVENDKYPYYHLNLMRRRCFEYLYFKQQVAPKYIHIIENGGLGQMRAIITDELPNQLYHHPFDFFSYKNNKEIQKWIDTNPGRKVIPIIDLDGYNAAKTYIGKQAAENKWRPMYERA